MLGWFKKKFGKKETPVPPEGEQPEIIKETEQDKAAPVDEVVTPAGLPAAEPAPAETALAPTAPSTLFERLRIKLAKTRDSIVSRVDRLFLGKKVIDAELLDDLEEILIGGDLGVATTQALLEDAREKLRRKELGDPQILKELLRQRILEYLLAVDKPAEMVMPESGPFVIMVVGVNGVGKTTTIGKMAHKFVHSGQTVLLVAADTFRAAAIDQLKIWGERSGVKVFTAHPGAAPSSVVFDALDYALARGVEVVIVDTAGRLHTKANLMEELRKIKRVMDKKIPGAPHEVMLILDATTGQNAISQAKLFHEAVQLTGLTLTKLDGTAKGGIVVNICHDINVPIRFIGIGESVEDLRDFDPKEFVEALFAREGAAERPNYSG